jgi:4a-hydroxytetrahydrobiopterin dehydratase
MPGVELVNRIAPVAEAEKHHPDLLVAYGAVTVWLWTHAAGGITQNDFILAAKIDRL